VTTLEASITEKEGFMKIGKEAIGGAHLQRLQVTADAGVEDASVSRFLSYVGRADRKLKEDSVSMIALRGMQVESISALAAQVSSLVADPLGQASKKREEMRASIHRAKDEVAALRAEKERQLKLIEEAKVQKQQFADKITVVEARDADVEGDLLELALDADEARKTGKELAAKIQTANERVTAADKEAVTIENHKRDAETRQRNAVAFYSEAAARHSLVTGRNPPDRLRI
jgi:chromosome segregation ATPase